MAHRLARLSLPLLSFGFAFKKLLMFGKLFKPIGTNTIDSSNFAKGRREVWKDQWSKRTRLISNQAPKARNVIAWANGLGQE